MATIYASSDTATQRIATWAIIDEVSNWPGSLDTSMPQSMYWSLEPQLWTQAIYADLPRAALDGMALARVDAPDRWLTPEPPALRPRRHRLTIAPRACAAARQPRSAAMRYRRTMRGRR